MTKETRGLGLYLHIPFCVRKCRYCDFNSCAAAYKERTQYLAALEAEIERRGKILGEASNSRVATIYLGGGTPTTYEADDLARLLQRVHEVFEIDEQAEITCEANPGTVTARSLVKLKESGLNRLSLGVQSFRDEELEFLGRIHTAQGADKAFQDARLAGFDNISIDLMRALPGQTAENWTYSLQHAIELGPEHISTYGLTIEPGTPLAEDLRAGRIAACDEDTQVVLFELTREMLISAGYEHYEISNYARLDNAGGACGQRGLQSAFRCRHNENYWRNGEYLGLGAGAWSYLAGVRSRNVAPFANYMAAVLAGFDATVEHEALDRETALGETVMLALRTADGVSYARLQHTFGLDVQQRYAAHIKQLQSLGLVESDSEGFRLTPKGYLVQSEIAALFL